MPNSTLHTELKTALGLLGITLSSFAANLIKPDGSVGISHTYLIKVAKEEEDSEWVEDEIQKVIRRAHKEHPEFYGRKTTQV